MANNFITGISSQIASSALRGALGKYPGSGASINGLSFNNSRGSGGANTSDTRPLAPSNNSSNYTFPLDVLADAPLGNQGHYMMFYINQQQKAKISFGGKGRNMNSGGGTGSSIPQYIKTLHSNGQYSKTDNSAAYKQQQNLNVEDSFASYGNTGPAAKYSSVEHFKEYSNWYYKNRKAIAIERAETKRMTSAIAMFMPAQVSTSYGAQYTDTEMGELTEAALNAYEKFSRGNMRGGMDEIGQSGTALANMVSRLMLTSLGAMPGMAGAKAASEMKSGVVLSDRLELAFKGIDKRKFEYTFKMIPKSEEEAKEIRNIIFAFKSSMMPEFEGGNLTGRRLIVPNTFDIEYMWNGQQNNFISRISECVLTNMSVAYGGDRYKTHEPIQGDGAPPIETTITLSFSELELITRERIHEGF